MKVIQTIQTKIQYPEGDPYGDPVEVTFYTGEDKVQALAALISAAAAEDTKYYRILDTRIVF